MIRRASMARIAVTRALPFAALDRLRGAHDVVAWPDPVPPAPAQLRELAADADGLLCLLTDRVDAALLDAAPRLRAVAVFAVGTDNVDLAAARARGVAVGSTPGVLTEATADLAFALLLAAARRLPEAQRAVRDGQWRTWEPASWLGLELNGATLGIVGAGRIGRAVARRGAGFGMEVLTHRPVALEEVLERSDVVSLHVPLRPATRHLIDAAALARMKDTAILVNTARGAIVDQAALAAALHAGRLGAAALDVTDPEPPAPDDPLLRAPNLLVAPHIGSATHATRSRMAQMAVDNLLAALDGRPMPHGVAG
jgi:glyoxylate reductase